MTDSGSGDKDTRPFTVEARSDLKITVVVRARAAIEYVGLSWYLRPVGERVGYITSGDVNEEQGTFEFYAAAIPPGNYHIHVLAANYNWESRSKR